MRNLLLNIFGESILQLFDYIHAYSDFDTMYITSILCNIRYDVLKSVVIWSCIKILNNNDIEYNKIIKTKLKLEINKWLILIN
jgi:hypothetical protein